MSKNFEKEYKEYLNAQAPDLWDRIEAGVDALEKSAQISREAEGETTEKVVGISAKKSKKKRRVRYQHYRMIASVAACLFALVIVVPVYLFTRQNEKTEMAADSVPQKIENVTIENLVVDASESETTAEEAAPMAEATDSAAEIEIPQELLEAEILLAETGTEQKATGTGETQMPAETESGENTEHIAGPQEPSEDGNVANMLQEEESGQQKEMTVTIRGEGTQQDGGVMYTAVENGSEASATVNLFVPEETAVVLVPDGTYVVSVKISEDGLYYIVAGAALQ